jgi:NADH-quinone oxidoreductase subunit M
MAEFIQCDLSVLILLPSLGALALLFVPQGRTGSLFGVALFFTSVAFVWSLKVLAGFEPDRADMQMVERFQWIPAYGVHYLVGVDGISLFLVLLTTLLGPIVILASWRIERKVKEYLFLMLVLQTGMLGAFVALDLFLFYVFWEVMLIPMYFLIGVWGGAGRRYAAIKFVLYTVSGSLLMLVGIIYLVTRYFQVTEILTFDLMRLQSLNLPYREQLWLFLAFSLSFAIKVPIFPLHTWLPDAHVEAPTAASVVLAGILLKMGTYGFVRFAMPLFPEAALAAVPYVMTLAVIGAIYGAAAAVMQNDIKRLVAYTSVSHLGFVMVGLFAFNTPGIQGALYHMLSHGLSTGALFLLVGMIYERRHTRRIDDFGGLWQPLPVFSACFMLVTFASIGLPGLNGFVGEFLILLGAFEDHPAMAAATASGIVFGAIAMLWMYRRVFFGPLTRAENHGLADLGTREVVLLAPILFLLLWMGLYPRPFLMRMKPAVESVVRKIEGKKQAVPLIVEGGAGEIRADGN